LTTAIEQAQAFFSLLPLSLYNISKTQPSGERCIYSGCLRYPFESSFSSRARVDSKKKWNSNIVSWTSSKNKLSILSLPLLTQESNVGNDELMSQSSFDVIIKEEDYLASLCPDPYLLLSRIPSDDQLKKLIQSYSRE
jgi:hypothetical protein